MSRKGVDTNVVLHLYDTADVVKQAVAINLMAQGPVVSQQVISEYFNVLRRKKQLIKQELLAMGMEAFGTCAIVSFSHATLAEAARLVARYDFQLFDSIIVAAALEAGCDVLYSADFQHNQLIDGRLRILNPFLPA